ncbi:MAG: hypothetical protein ACP5II_02425 [Infirmifilum sp.]|uniref:hypothetical protein n=1 Tax=Infirmifilum TaxID=2856573 RepID=UPI002354756A
MEVASLEKISDKFGIKLCERKIVFESGKEGVLASIDLPLNAEAFVVHTPEGSSVASKPEIVGRELDSAIIEPARVTASFLKQRLEGVEDIVFLHVLRGSQGYRLDVALREAGFEIREEFVRVVYEGTGEKHLDSSPRIGRVLFGELSGKEKVLVVADTVATGRTLLEALRVLLDLAQFKGVEFKQAIVYGFISENGATKVSEFLEKRGITPFLISIENFSALASNMFDMPLYGPDVTRDKIQVDKLIAGSTIPLALKSMLEHYFPGLDQPGDWSERQCLLFNGTSYERGRIEKHLENSMSALENLYSAIKTVDWFENWMGRVYQERKKGLRKAMRKDYCAPEL